MIRSLFFIYFLFSFFSIFSQRFRCGCSELTRENYTSSRNQFEKIRGNEFLKNAGLSRYFFNKKEYDKAYEKATLALDLWSKESFKNRNKASVCQLDSMRFEEIKRLSAYCEIEKMIAYPTIVGWSNLISKFSATINLEEASYHRDSLMLSAIIETKKSDKVQEFINQFPNSYFINKAREFYCEFQYNEEVPVETLENLESFVEKHADNCKIDQVHFSIYSIFRKTQQIKELERYISKYPNQPWVTQAWRAIYELYVGEWDEEKISSFRSLYPNYPFMEELTRDLALLNEELYPIEKDGLYGYINAKGKVVIPFSYEDAGFFNNGIAVVQQNEKFGAINKRNQVIIPFHYETIYDFDQDVAIAGDTSFYGLISKTGEIIVSFKYTEIKKINPVVFVFQDSTGFGFFNVRGIPLKNEVYEEITELPGGMFKCKVNAKIGILNAKLNEIVPMQFDEVEKFDDTLFIVNLSGKYGIYNANKGMLVQPNYERIKILDASKSLMLVKKLKELQICKFSGTKHISLSFEYSQRLFDLISFYQNTSVFSQKGKFGILDGNGKVVLKPQYEEMGKTNSLTPFKLNNQWGFLNQTAVKVNPMYDACYTPNKLGYVVEKNGKQGVIDYNGKEIISLQYNSVKWLKEGYYILDFNGLLGLANEFGTIIVPCGNKSIQAMNSDLFLLQNSNEIRYFIPSKSLWIKAQDE